LREIVERWGVLDLTNVRAGPFAGYDVILPP
jgi:hypothetical protein